MLFCRYSAVHLPGTYLDDGRVNVVIRDHPTDSWQEFTQKTTFDDARCIIAQLKALGIPSHTPQTYSVFDTSDGWTNLLVRVKVDKDVMSFEIGMACSGFDGADAEPLRVLFRDLFALAGFEGYNPSVYGERMTPPHILDILNKNSESGYV